MTERQIQFGQIPFWAICRFSERTKIEIIVFSFLCAKRFRNTQEADCPRGEIIEKTGLDKSQVSSAIKKLTRINWLESKSKTKWFIPEIEPEKVDESSTNSPEKKLTISQQKVDDSSTKVDDLSTKVDESSTFHNKDNNTHTTDFSDTHNACACGDTEQEIWDGLAERRLDTPFENPKWSSAIAYAFSREISAADFLGCIDWLKTSPDQKWRKARISAEIVTNNLSLYLDSRPPPGNGNGKPKTCDKCEATNGLIETENGYSKCQHNDS